MWAEIPVTLPLTRLALEGSTPVTLIVHGVAVMETVKVMPPTEQLVKPIVPMVAMLAPVALVAAMLPAVTLEEAHVRVAAGTVSVGLVALAVYAPLGVADQEEVVPAEAVVTAIPRAAAPAVVMIAAL